MENLNNNTETIKKEEYAGKNKKLSLEDLDKKYIINSGDLSNDYNYPNLENVKIESDLGENLELEKVKLEEEFRKNLDVFAKKFDTIISQLQKIQEKSIIKKHKKENNNFFKKIFSNSGVRLTEKLQDSKSVILKGGNEEKEDFLKRNDNLSEEEIKEAEDLFNQFDGLKKERKEVERIYTEKLQDFFNNIYNSNK